MHKYGNSTDDSVRSNLSHLTAEMMENKMVLVLCEYFAFLRRMSIITLVTYNLTEFESYIQVQLYSVKCYPGG